MLQRYKVRLGDGAILTVDDDGLRAWANDRHAAVHVAGLQEWRPVREFLAEEEARERLARALVPPSAQRAPTRPQEVTPPSAPLELSIGQPPLLQALAEDPTSPATAAAPRRDPLAAAEGPVVLRLKPDDDEPPRPAPARLARVYGDDREDEGLVQRHDRLDGPVLAVITAFATLLSRCLDPLTPLVRGWPPRFAARSAPAGRATTAPAPAKTRPPLFGSAFAWISGLTGRVGRTFDTARPTPPGAPPAHSTQAAPPRQALAAPVPLDELPVLRFAAIVETPDPGDVYEGEEEGSRFWHSAIWLWTKRVTLAGGLATAAMLAALNWETWFPRAVALEQTLLSEVDRQLRSRQRAAEQQQAQRETSERLPHLAPATIALLLATGEVRVPDPPETFQLASEAADRGRGSLTPSEAEELRALQGELLAHLPPQEREQVADYERARSRRVIFPFENPPVLELVARGARAMPERSRERLQTLLGRAVVAGLRVPASADEASRAHSAPAAGR